MKTTKEERDKIRMANDARPRRLQRGKVGRRELMALLDDADELERLREGLQKFIRYARGFYLSIDGERTTSNREREEMQAEWDAHVAALLDPAPRDKEPTP
jgi:hypothetical protein